MKTLFTIGYEGATLADLIETLEVAGVEHVLDVREIPQSRRPGFSKNVLAAALAEAGIDYSHAKQLGDPKEGREAARRGDLQTFREVFQAHLALNATEVALSHAVQAASEKPTALLCYERDPRHCHRTLVAQRMSEVCSLNVRNLGVAHNAKGRSRTVREAA